MEKDKNEKEDPTENNAPGTDGDTEAAPLAVKYDRIAGFLRESDVEEAVMVAIREVQLGLKEYLELIDTMSDHLWELTVIEEGYKPEGCYAKTIPYAYAPVGTQVVVDVIQPYDYMDEPLVTACPVGIDGNGKGLPLPVKAVSKTRFVFKMPFEMVAVSVLFRTIEFNVSMYCENGLIKDESSDGTRAGNYVYFSIGPNPGYRIDSCSVTTTPDGEEVPFEHLTDNEYRFVMPPSDVSIEASCVPIP